LSNNDRFENLDYLLPMERKSRKSSEWKWVRRFFGLEGSLAGHEAEDWAAVHQQTRVQEMGRLGRRSGY
jgi:hypothetical protein